jgi:hypothetical protein
LGGSSDCAERVKKLKKISAKIPFFIAYLLIWIEKK